MLLKTDFKLGLINDLSVLYIMGRMKRGGLVFVGSKRHVVANNSYMKNYDDTQESNYLIHLDANNLYGWAMSESLPYDDVTIINNVKIEDVLTTTDDNDIGYIIELDFESLNEIHDKLNEYQPAPEI